MPPAANARSRCPWSGNDPLYVQYHDDEWGVPRHDDRILFEKLTLEGAQAGLSWITILRKRENYRRLFAEFDIEKIARFTPAKIERLLTDPGIVRNRAKVESTVANARAARALIREAGSLDAYFWSWVDGKPIQNRWKSMAELPSESPLSRMVSKDLKKRGFGFVGPTTIYAFMQAMGMVNDHLVSCFRHREVAGLAPK